MTMINWYDMFGNRLNYESGQNTFVTWNTNTKTTKNYKPSIKLIDPNKLSVAKTDKTITIVARGDEDEIQFIVDLSTEQAKELAEKLANG